MRTSIIRQALLCTIIAASLPVCRQASAAGHYDVVKDFNVKANPNGPWTYMDEATLAYAHREFEGVTGLDNWSDDDSPGDTATIARNKTGQTVTLENGTVTFPPDYLLINPEEHRPAAIVQFQAPVTGSYTIKGNFVHLATNEINYVPVAIYLGTYQSGTQLFYNRINKINKPRKFNLTTAMQAGQTLQFFVDSARKQRPDYVGLQVKIVGP